MPAVYVLRSYVGLIVNITTPIPELIVLLFRLDDFSPTEPASCRILVTR